MTRKLILILLFSIILGPLTMMAEPELVFEINIKDHIFTPAEITIPAGVKVKLIINNLDHTVEEFESFELRKEKIIPANASRQIMVGPLKPGVYNFFGEFHPKTAQGKIIVK